MFFWEHHMNNLHQAIRSYKVDGLQFNDKEKRLSCKIIKIEPFYDKNVSNE